MPRHTCFSALALPALAAAGLTLVATPAAAAPSPGASIEGSASTSAASSARRPSSSARRFRLHADTEFFGWTHIDDEMGMPAADDINVIGFGIGRPNMGDAGACSGGILFGGCVLSVRPLWGVGFGYALLDQQAIIGGRFSFTVDGIFDDDNNDDDQSTLVAGQFVPYFRWIFLPGNTVRPYVEVRFGLGGGAVISNAEMSNDQVRGNVIYPTVGGGGGAHIFLMDALSLDVGLNVDYFAPHSKTTFDPDPADVSTDYEQVANVLNMAVLAGFSVWIP